MHDQGSLLQNLTTDGAERAIARVKRPDGDPVPATTTDCSPGWNVDGYLEHRRQEDDEFFEMLNEIANKFFWHLDALNSRQDGIEKMKKFRKEAPYGKK